jgi:hypothetical protein
LSYPIVVDSNYEIWKLFACRCWPTKYLIDKEGYLRYAHFGEGAYGECEEAIQDLLREIDSAIVLPAIMEPVRAEDRPGARCYAATPELYLGHRRGKIGNISGFKEDQIADYSFTGEPEEGSFYVTGRWASTAEYMESAGDEEHRIVLKYSAAGVNLVMASPRSPSCDVIIRQDGKPLTARVATPDVRFRGDESFVPVSQARMYSVVANADFGTHTLELLCPAGLGVFAFTFTSCVDPSASTMSSGVPVL